MSAFEIPSATWETETVGAPLPERRICEGNHYGNLDIAARHCGLAAAPYSIPGEWQHGWHPPEHNIHPELVVGSDGLSRFRKRRPIWVAREDQEIFLRNAGYSRVKAIGLPIVYLAKPPVQRLTGSLLVMPLHSLPSTMHDWDADGYVAQIRAVASRFSAVIACVHPSCFEKGYWVGAFRNAGISVVSGATLGDRNGLARMAALFSRFEYVTSNGVGSHLPYAALFGAKPSIYGSIAIYKPEDLAKDSFYRNCPEVLGALAKITGEEYLRATYPRLLRNPWEGEECVKWAAWQLGVQFRQTPSELQRLFRWRPMDRYDPRIIPRRIRSGIRREANRLFLTDNDSKGGK
jgi:hypothetical protein